MIFKRQILLTLAALLCLLSAQAQLVFEPAVWDFGSIREADGRVSHTFSGINRGDKALVILDVTTTCGCTVPRFSQQPVVVGGQTQITVSFDPTNRPGAFTKELWVYSTERRHIATLTIRGTVTPRPKSIEELYPVDAGGGLRLTSTLCALSYIYQGKRAQSTIGYANTTGRTLTLAFQITEGSQLLTMDYPRTIAPEERGELNFTYNIPADKPRYGTLRDVLQPVIDGRTSNALVMIHAIGVDNPTNMPTQSVPCAQLSENMLKFGTIKRTSAVERRSFTLTNAGDSELIVRAVESPDEITTSLYAGQRITPGASFTAQVALRATTLDFGALSRHVVLITNDPVRPMRRLRVTAIIED